MVKHQDNLKVLTSGNDCAKSYMKMVSENQQIVDNVDFKGNFFFFLTTLTFLITFIVRVQFT